MINDLLRNMVEAEDIVAFIDNVMVEIERDMTILWKKY